jgi:hypothetical protein
VLDEEPPVIVGCPGNLTNYTALGNASAVVTFGAPLATDNCDGNVPVVCRPPSGSLFPVGLTTVICRATDSSGNTNFCSFTVAVVPTQGPLITDLKVEGTNVVIRFDTVSAGNYSVQASGSVIGSWTDVLTGIPGTGSSVTATIVGGATFLPQFFRIKLSLP